MEQVATNIEAHDFSLNEQQQCSSAAKNWNINLNKQYNEDMNYNAVDEKNLIMNIEDCS